jgi:Flp pilus assembly protein TadG
MTEVTPKRMPSRGSDTGAALVELAITMPMLVLILVGTIDFARVFYTGIALENAARAGAQYGSNSLGQSGDFAGMQNAAINSVNTTGISAVASRLCQCATLDGATFSNTSPSANNCSATESVACGSGRLVITVTVTTSKTFTLTAPYPGMPWGSGVPLTRAATMRVVN